ncbi:hypothetical protein, partial [Caballeronia mineralivorans]|uniref:hypothetical protein n=1 Tax=Caballeronia mineralivorans TaxID=2010198 RepID=UPI002B0034A1
TPAPGSRAFFVFVNVGDKDASIEDQSSLSRRFPAKDRSAEVSGHINVDARASGKADDLPPESKERMTVAPSEPPKRRHLVEGSDGVDNGPSLGGGNRAIYGRWPALSRGHSNVGYV